MVGAYYLLEAGFVKDCNFTHSFATCWKHSFAAFCRESAGKKGSGQVRWKDSFAARNFWKHSSARKTPAFYCKLRLSWHPGAIPPYALSIFQRFRNGNMQDRSGAYSNLSKCHSQVLASGSIVLPKRQNYE
jgi:hypothetical protein